VKKKEVKALIDQGENLAKRINDVEFTAFKNFAEEVNNGLRPAQDLVDKISELDKNVKSI